MTNSFRTTFCTVRTLEPERCSSEAQNRNPILIPSFSLPNPYPFVNPVFFNTTRDRSIMGRRGIPFVSTLVDHAPFFVSAVDHAPFLS